MNEAGEFNPLEVEAAFQRWKIDTAARAEELTQDVRIAFYSGWLAAIESQKNKAP